MARNLTTIITSTARISIVALAILLSTTTILAQTSSSWVDNANGQAQDCNGSDPGGEFFYPDNNLWSQEEVFGTFAACGPGLHMLQPSNWSTANYPDNGNGAANYDVTLGSPANTELNIDVTIDSLTVIGSGSLDMLAGASLEIAEGSLTNNSSITINSNSLNVPTDLTFLTDATLSGSGSLLLNWVGNRAAIVTVPATTLTHAAGHKIFGVGDIDAALINNGLIEADATSASFGDILDLQTNDKTNNNIMRALGGSILRISGIEITQDNAIGRLIADGGTVDLVNGTTITHGKLETSSGGVVKTSGTVTLNAVTNLGALDVKISSILQIAGGSLTNNSAITVNDTDLNAPTTMTFLTDTTLDGSGSILLNRVGNRARINTDPSATLTHAAGHKIFGVGDIDAALINNGVIEADELSAGTGTILDLQTNDKTNNNIMRALVGSTLQVSNITISQDDTSGRLIAADGTINLTNGATISQGRLETSGSGIVKTSGTVTLDAITNLAEIDVQISSILQIAGGSLTNNSAITVNDTDLNAPTTMTFLTDTTLDGSGSILLNRVGNRARINTDPSATLTHAAGHKIFGVGDIDAALINNGVIEADELSAGTGTILDLQTNDKTNNNIMRALVGSTLKINGITVTQDDATGQIIADDGIVELSGSGTTIANGRLEATGTGTIESLGSSILTDVTLSGRLNQRGNSTLTVNGASLVNNGTLTVNSNNILANTTLLFDSNAILTGTGEIVLGREGRADLNSVPGTTLAHASTHTIRGEGRIGAALINEGLVEAQDTPGVGSGLLELRTENKTNNNIMRASSGTTLRINGVAITQDQANGEIVALDGGTVELRSGASIVGGTLRSELSGIVEHDGGAATLEDVTFSGKFNTLGGLTTTFAGTSLTNNGVITVDSNNILVNTFVSFDGGVALGGSGQIVLNRETRAKIITTVGSTVTQAFTHTIRGEGQISARLINKGLVEAFDGPGTGTGVLELLGENKNNDHLMQATAGSTLRISGTTITQRNATGQIVALDGGVVELRSGATVVEGRIRSEGTGLLQHTSGAATLEDVTLEGIFNTVGGVTTTIAGTLLTNNATLTVNSNNIVANTALHFSESGNIGGTGEIVLVRATRAKLSGDLGVQMNQGVNHTIRGNGQINVDLRNSGRIEGNSGTDLLEINSTVSGAGILKDVRIDGTHAPGNSPRAVDVEGVYEISNVGSLEIEIGGLLLNQFDQVNSTLGAVSLNGTLDVTVEDFGFGYVPETNDTFTIITSTSPITGTFATTNLPTIGGGKQLDWQINYNSNSVVLQLLAADFLDADFDEDGDVDAADLGDWQTGFGTSSGAAHGDGDANQDGDVDGADFLTWQRQFASPPAIVSAADTAIVPEPPTALLLLIAVFFYRNAPKASEESCKQL